MLYLIHLLTEYEYTDEDTSDATPIATDEAEEEEGGTIDGAKAPGIQFVITNRMKRVLEDDLNYHEEEISVMDPQIASVVIERGLARPATGMPRSWQKIQPSKPMLLGLRKRIASGFLVVQKRMRFMVMKVLPIAVPIAGAVIALPTVIRVMAKSSVWLAATVRSNYRQLSEDSSGRLISDSNSNSGQPASTPKLTTKPSSRTTKTAATNSKSDSTDKINNRIDMRALNQVVRPSTLLEKMMGR